MTQIEARRWPAVPLIALLLTAAFAISAPDADAGKRPRCMGRKATIVSAKKKVNGTNRSDVIVGKAKSQRINGRGGNDVICGGGGNDKIYGGPGNDRMDGGRGKDLCTENAGAGTKVRCESPLVLLAVSKVGAGSGSVTSAPGGIGCGATCSGSYLEGSAVALSAVPAPGSAFAGWSGACSGIGGCTANLWSPTSVTANFTLNGHLLSVSKLGTGGGTVTSSPAGVSCGGDCTETFVQGTPLTLTAPPASGSVFAGWAGDCSGTGTCNLTMSGPRTVTATFDLGRTLTVERSGSGSGSVTSAPVGVSCGSDCDELLPHGSEVTLTAVPSVGSTFGGWSGGGCSGTGQCVVTLNSDVTVTAAFQATSFNLLVSTTGTGSGTVQSSPAGIDCGTDCNESYPASEVVTLTPDAGSGSAFDGWSGDCSGTGSCNVTMDGAKSVTATFTVGRALTISPQGNGSGTVTSSPPGITCGGDCADVYTDGIEVILTGSAAAGSTFDGWAGCDSAAGSQCTVAMSTDRTVQATFTLQTHLLTVDRTGQGTVSSAPAGIDCGTDCNELYDHGTQVTLTASPPSGWSFTGWSGACSGAGDCNVTMDSAKTVDATFVQQLTLTISKPGAGTGTVSSDIGGIDCGPTCSDTYDQGTAVVLTAVAGPSSTFAGWSGGGCSGTGTCSVTLNGNVTVTASFDPITHNLTVSRNGSGTGTVTSVPTGISCGADCAEAYVQGTPVTLTATPDSDSVFTGWSGEGCSGTGTCLVTMDGAKSVAASFTAGHTLTVSSDGTGGGQVTSDPAGVSCPSDCGESFLDGTVVTLTATPDANSTFTAWGGACSGSGSCLVTMSADRSVTATFTKNTYQLTVGKNGSGTGTLTSSPTGINCGADCDHVYDSGTQVILVAAESVGSVFDRWTGCDSPDGSECTMTMTSAKTVTATFKLLFTLTVGANGTGGGAVSSDPAGIDCGGDCTEDYSDGTPVVLTAAANSSSVLSSWTGCDSTNGNECTVAMTDAKAVTATFTQAFTLTVSKTGPGVVTTNPAGVSCGSDCNEKYAAGTSVTLTATHNTGGAVVWGAGACFGTVGNQCTVIMSIDRTITVTFV